MESQKEYPKNFGFSDEYAFTEDKPIFEYEHFESTADAMIEAKRLEDAIWEGDLVELEDPLGCDFAGLYIGGTYKKVLRLYSRVPTFDASDREYDSYRVTAFIRDKSDKYYLAKYAGGRYLARMTVYGELIRFPEKYKELLK